MQLHTIRSYITPRVVISTAAVLSVATVAIAYVITAHKPAAAYVSPTVANLTQQVTTTGTVAAATSVDLSFQSGGQIAYAGPSVGTKVSAGTTLATLSAQDLAAQLEQAKANLAAQNAKLASIQQGATPEQIAQAQTGVSNAQASLVQAQQALIQASSDAYLKADDAVLNKGDQIFSNPSSLSPTLLVTSNNSQLQQSVISGRIAMGSMLAAWQTYETGLAQTPASSIDAGAVASTTRAYLSQTTGYLNDLAALLQAAVPSTSYNTSALAAAETNMTAARSNVSADTIALNSALASFTGAQSALASAQSALAVTQEPATAPTIAAQQAAIASAQASVDLAQAQLGKTVITAPIGGTITVNNAKVGQTASAGVPIVSMISDTKFEIDAYVSQADIGKIALGQSAAVTLDGYQGAPAFAAHVTKIDPAATTQNGVASYKVTIQFDNDDARISAGMTGSAVISTASVAGTLTIPTSAVITNGTSSFVMKKTSSGDALTPVTIGIEGGDGMTQVLSGLSASDVIRTFGTQ